MKKQNTQINTTLIFGLLLGILIISPSCSDLMLWEKDEARINKELKISTFNQINIENLFDIELIQDSQEYIIATGTQAQLNELELQNKNDILYLKHNYSSLTRNFEHIKLEIHLKTINTIKIEAPANITSQSTLILDKLSIEVIAKAELVEMDLELNCNKLLFHSYGSAVGGYKFSGECPNTSYTLNGVTNILASNFRNQNINIAQNGIGEAHIYAENKISATIYNSGNIYYKGNPKTIELKRIQINNQKPTSKLIPE